MTQLFDFRSFHQIDAWVEQFEQALLSATEVSLEDYLPQSSHPVYEDVLCELIRVDLEYHQKLMPPRQLEYYQERFPGFFQSPTNCQKVAYEEYRLRQQAGAHVQWQEYQNRFGLGPLDKPVSDEHQTLRREVPVYERGDEQGSELLSSTLHGGRKVVETPCPLRASPGILERILSKAEKMPEVGSNFLGFHLKSELGRGAFGRVFLAEQRVLSDRLVALKVSPDSGLESQTLAKLQHTNVVPIYSVHREGPYQATCMPFLGSTTLADLLADIRSRGTLPNGGDVVYTTIESRAQSSDPGSGSQRSLPQSTQSPESSDQHPARETTNVAKPLRELSFVEAILWIGRGLAEGLAHAHQRGILHRDIKPANVLLTDDGLPMLLDFNLAEDTRKTDAGVARMGGTLPYMAPEQFELFRGEDREVDERSDVYSLGVVLYELLTGSHPFDLPPRLPGEPRPSIDKVIHLMLELRKKPIQPARKRNSRISPAVQSIIDHCLEEDPAERYQSAADLSDDLQRQLESRPLKHAREKSWGEIIQKLIRRSPNLLRRGALLTAFVVILFAGWLTYRLQSSQKEREAQQLRLVQGSQKEQARKQKALFEQDYNEALFHLSTQSEDWYLDQGMTAAKRALERFHVLKKKDWQQQAPGQFLPPKEREDLEAHVGPLLLLMSASQLRDSSGERSAQNLERTRTWITLAEKCLSREAPSRAVLLHFADYLEANGQRKEADQTRQKAGTVSLSSAADHFLVAQRLVIQQKPDKAIFLLDRAWEMDPQGYWINFLRGVCFDQMGLDERAEGAYRACLAIDPQHYGAAFNLGLAQLRLRSYHHARISFDFAIEKRPKLPNLYVNRALAWMGLKQNDEAILDLTSALDLGASTRAWFLRSRAKQRVGDTLGAKLDHEMGLKEEPGDEVSFNARGLALLKRKDPHGALSDFEQALQLNPRSRKAMSNLAHVLSEHLDRPAEAIAILDRMSRLYPEHAACYSGRGVLRARLGRRTEAIRDAQRTLQRSSHPSHLYQVGCIYALTSKVHKDDQREAMRWIRRAIKEGFGASYVATDPDLNPLRSLPEFQKLVQAAATLRQPQ